MSATDSARPFVLKREVDLGQLLTAFAILVSLAGFAYTWVNDRALKDKEYADRVRKSAATVTAKVERWGELAERYFEDLQPTLVDVSEKVAATNSTQPANRMLFKGLMDAKARASQRIVDEQLQIAYMELYGYVPVFQKVFDRTINDIRIAEAAAQESLRLSLQDVLRDRDVLAMKESPSIGKRLRDEVERERSKLRAKIAELSLPLRSKMLEVIRLSDSELRDAQQTPRLQTVFAEKTSSSVK